jgi:hypothetical protein
MTEDDRREHLVRVRELIDGGDTPAELPVHFVLALASLRDQH